MCYILNEKKAHDKYNLLNLFKGTTIRICGPFTYRQISLTFLVFCSEQLPLKLREELGGCQIPFCNLPNTQLCSWAHHSKHAGSMGNWSVTPGIRTEGGRGDSRLGIRGPDSMGCLQGAQATPYPSTCPSSWATGGSVMALKLMVVQEVLRWFPWPHWVGSPQCLAFPFGDEHSNSAWLLTQLHTLILQLVEEATIAKETTPFAVKALGHLSSPTPQSAKLLNSETVNGLDISDNLQNGPCLCVSELHGGVSGVRHEHLWVRLWSNPFGRI